MIYGNEPKRISYIGIDVQEMMYFQYYPIKSGGEICYEERLDPFMPLISTAVMYEHGRYELTKYAYISAKNIFCPTGSNINRPGWHSDGFLSDDVNYIWSNELPTEYITGVWWGEEDIPLDHSTSLEVFERLGRENEIKICEPNVLYRLDQSVIHRPSINTGPPVLRCFVKISFSNQVYNLKGNSINYRLPSIEYKERDLERNHPSKI